MEPTLRRTVRANGGRLCGARTHDRWQSTCRLPPPTTSRGRRAHERDGSHETPVHHAHGEPRKPRVRRARAPPLRRLGLGGATEQKTGSDVAARSTDRGRPESPDGAGSERSGLTTRQRSLRARLAAYSLHATHESSRDDQGRPSSLHLAVRATGRSQRAIACSGGTEASRGRQEGVLRPTRFEVGKSTQQQDARRSLTSTASPSASRRRMPPTLDRRRGPRRSDA